MAIGKWIGGFLGLLNGGPLGALAGFALGSLFDTLTANCNGFATPFTWNHTLQRGTFAAN